MGALDTIIIQIDRIAAADEAWHKHEQRILAERVHPDQREAFLGRYRLLKRLMRGTRGTATVEFWYDYVRLWNREFTDPELTFIGFYDKAYDADISFAAVNIRGEWVAVLLAEEGKALRPFGWRCTCGADTMKPSPATREHNCTQCNTPLSRWRKLPEHIIVEQGGGQS